jgi:hypothetical protein
VRVVGLGGVALRRPARRRPVRGARGETDGLLRTEAKDKVWGQGYNGHSMLVWFKIQMNLDENPAKGK